MWLPRNAHGEPCNGRSRAHCVDVGSVSCWGRVSFCTLACPDLARSQKNGEKKLRALLCRTPEWADAAARAAVAESCDAAAADDESGAFATLAAVMRGADTSASLRKSHLLMLARCWGYQSSLWVRKESRKRMPLQPEPLPPPLHPRRSESLAAAAAARAAAEEARRAAAFQQHPPGSAFPRAFPCVASAITAALADSSGGGSGGAMQPGEAGRYSSTLSDGAAALMGAPPSNRSSTTSVALPSDVEAGVRAWLAIDAAAPGLAQAAAEAEARAWRERAAAHVAASAPQHTAGPLHWGVAPPIEQWLAQPHGGAHPHQQAPSAAVMEALAAAMERGEEYVDDPMTWGY